MKTKLFILLLTIVPLCLLADDLLPKDKYANGKVFLLNNDTLSVYIKVESIYNMQNSIQYVDSKGMEYKTDPTKAKGFWLIYPEDTMKFDSRNDMIKVLLQPKKDDHFFVLSIHKGNLPLYYFIEKKLEMDGIDQILVDKSRYFILFNNNWYPISKEEFTRDFRKLISVMNRAGYDDQIKDLARDFNNHKYKFKDTPELVKMFDKLISPVK